MASGGELVLKRIGDIFNIGTGSLLNTGELNQGEIKRVSVKSDNNGIIGEYDTLFLDKARHFSNFISVNFFGGVFYHPYQASVEMKVHTLKIDNFEFNKETGLYFASIVKKALAGLFSYGNQLSSSLLKSGDYFVKIPYLNGEIAIKYIEEYMRELQAERLRELQAERLRELQVYLKVTGLSSYELNDDEKIAIGGGKKKWQIFNLQNLFGSATRGKRLKSADRVDGKLPFVTAGEANMGISAFISNDVTIFKRNTITIDMFGSAKYRNYNYGADDHVAIVHTENLDKNAVLFVTTTIHKVANAGQFSYSRNFYAKDADELNIALPVNDINQPDYEYMKIYMSAIQKLIIKNLVDYTERELKAYQQAIGIRDEEKL